MTAKKKKNTKNQKQNGIEPKKGKYNEPIKVSTSLDQLITAAFTSAGKKHT